MRQELPLRGPGELVRVRGDSWRVLDLVALADCTLCRLAGVRPSNRGMLRTLLLPFDRPVAADRPRAPRGVGRRRFVAALAGVLAASTPWGGLRAAARARFDLFAYQLEPALACLAGETRLLIADEVGLGKTIEACLILAEIFARDAGARCLVLAPASLCPQWTSELQARFGLPAVHLDAACVRRLASSGPPDVSPWLQVPLAVTSFDYVKQPEVRAGIDVPPWDAIVVDEAHLAALAPERSKAIAALARRARRVVLLTATPSAAGAEGFQALCGTGRVPGEPDVVLFRRTRASLGLPVSRRIAILRTRLSAAERRMHRALDRYTLAVWQESAGGAGARLAMIVLRKRAASGAAALAASLARRLSWLSDDPRDGACQLLLPLLEADAEAADEAPDQVLAAPGLRDVVAERRRLAALLELATAAVKVETKLRILCRLLARTREPLIVFTEYRDTLSRLETALRAATSLSVLHGGLDMAARDASVQRFTSGAVRVLLATDAAAHGLNLQARCRLVVNVELPWSPARLEQRIGRVDRIGQRRTVHAIHLVAAGTSEELVFQRLAGRLARERELLGDVADPLGASAESDVAGSVFAQPRRPPWRRALPPGADEQEVRGPYRVLDLCTQSSEEMTRVARVRQAARRNEGGGRDAGAAGADPVGQHGDVTSTLVPCWTVLRAARATAALAPGLWCIFAPALVDGNGFLVEQGIVALQVQLHASLRARGPLVAAVPALLRECTPELRRIAAEVARARAEELRPALARSLRALVLRETAMAAEAGRPLAPLQPGLFDRRALKRADREASRRARDEVASREESVALARAARVELAGDLEPVLVLGIAK